MTDENLPDQTQAKRLFDVQDIAPQPNVDPAEQTRQTHYQDQTASQQQNQQQWTEQQNQQQWTEQQNQQQWSQYNNQQNQQQWTEQQNQQQWSQYHNQQNQQQWSAPQNQQQWTQQQYFNQGADASSGLKGESSLNEKLKEGYKAYLIAGVKQSGKSQIIQSFCNTDQSRCEPTPAGRIHIYPVLSSDNKLSKSKELVVDLSGEYFSNLYGDYSQEGTTQQDYILDEDSFRILQNLARQLSGVILVIDLQKLWQPFRRDRPEFKEQLDISVWTLQFLRWLRSYNTNNRPTQSISKQDLQFAIAKLGKRKRLDIPVLVLFSKADELVGVNIPESGPACPGRELQFPTAESPFFFTHCCLNTLYSGVLAHAKFFHFDFSNAICTDIDTGIIIDGSAYGVRLNMNWLMDKSWNSRWNVPTRYWVYWQMFLDSIRFRTDRWKQLQDPTAEG